MKYDVWIEVEIFYRSIRQAQSNKTTESTQVPFLIDSYVELYMWTNLKLQFLPYSSRFFYLTFTNTRKREQSDEIRHSSFTSSKPHDAAWSKIHSCTAFSLQI